jgi:SOS-response transcriptional repressor LexA
MPPFMTFNLNQRIKFARKKAGFSLRKVGAFFDPPISAQAVRAWERDDHPSIPEHWRLEVLATKLGVNYDWLATGKGEPERSITTGAEKEKLVPLVKLADLSFDNIEEQLAKALRARSIVPSFWEDESNRFASVMAGTSMSATYIEGDVVYFLRANRADPGDYVAAYVRNINQTIFRKLRYNEQSQVVLEPENKNWPPLTFNEDQVGRDIQVLGVLCGHFSRR